MSLNKYTFIDWKPMLFVLKMSLILLWPRTRNSKNACVRVADDLLTAYLPGKSCEVVPNCRMDRDETDLSVCVCVCVCLWRCTVPEQWSACVKDTLHASRAERDKTARMCAQIKELLRESTNEIWQHANIATNALSANIDRIQREKATSIDRLALVRAIISTIHCVRKKVTPCVLFYNSGKWFRILTTFCSNNAASNCKQTAKFQ